MTAKEIQIAFRSLSRRPALAFVVATSLSLGIAANVAVFGLAKAVWLEPLPFHEPDGLFILWERNFPRERSRNVVSPANFIDWKESSRAFASMSAFGQRRLSLALETAPAMVPAIETTEGFFEMLGVPPLMGRTFSPVEYREETAVAVITYDLWRGPLAGDPGILGKSIVLEGEPHSVIGVLPRNFRFEIPGTSYSFATDPAVFLARPITDAWRERNGRSLTVIARAAAGVGPDAARAEMDGIAERLRDAHPEFNAGWGVNVVPLKEQIVGESRATLILLWAAVSVMLVIVAVNVASLLLGRGLARRREIAIRTAMGARSVDLGKQLLLEGFLLTAVPAAVGLGLAYGIVQFLKRESPIPLPRIETVEVDGAVLWYTLGASVLIAVVFTIVPALQSRASDVHRALREEGLSSSVTRRHARLRGLLVVSEVALAVTLVSGAGLLARTLVALRGVDAGFDRDTVVTMKIALPDRYESASLRAGFYRALLARLEALPAVQASAVVSSLPLTGPHAATSFHAAGQPAPARGEAPVADVRIVRGDYFRTMGIPLVAGRPFDARDGADAPTRAIVSHETLGVLWPGEEPAAALGRTVLISWGELVAAEIVGVVGDVRHQGLDVAPRPMIYWTHEQNAWSDMTLVARTDDPDAAIAPLVHELAAMDPGVAPFDVGTMSEVLDASVADRRVSSFLLTLFAALALGLASLGVYGVVSFSAGARAREMSLRIALGATPSRVERLVLSEGLVPVAFGVGFGLVGASMTARWVAAMLYGISPNDPSTRVGSAMVLALVATLAAYLPARRASRLDPAAVLRSE